MQLWRSLIGPKIPFMVIGGVTKDKAADMFREGVDCVAVISEVSVESRSDELRRRTLIT